MHKTLFKSYIFSSSLLSLLSRQSLLLESHYQRADLAAAVEVGQSEAGEFQDAGSALPYLVPSLSIISFFTMNVDILIRLISNVGPRQTKVFSTRCVSN